MDFDDLECLGGSLIDLAASVFTVGRLPKQNQLAMSSKGALGIYDNGVFKPAVEFNVPSNFETHTFTNAGVVGRLGPTHAQLLSAYASTDWAADPEQFSSTDGIQLWTVPETAFYRIVTTGASRGADSKPVDVTLELTLTRGDKLEICVGQNGDNILTGCGASFVNSLAIGLICVSGGSGGGNVQMHVPVQLDAPGSGSGGLAAGSGTSGTTSGIAQGGAGWLANGAGATILPARLHNDGLPLRAVGGTGAGATRTSGGFGGGGGAGSSTYRSARGGGGGYTGGNAVNTSRTTENNSFPSSSGASGTCFAISGDGVRIRAGEHPAVVAGTVPGKVVITKLAE